MEGWLYVAVHPMTPIDRLNTKIGFSAIQPKSGHADSRVETMNFWLEAFGLGPVEIAFETYHARAHDIETRLKRKLKAAGNNAINCGRSTETYAITVADAQQHIEEEIAKYDAQTH